MDEIDQIGKWWVPEARYANVAGPLRFRPSGGAEVEFVDSLPVPVNWNGRIFGIGEGEKYTLCDCKIPPNDVGSSPNPSSAFPQAVLVGEHIHSNRSYNQMKVRFPMLEWWAGDSLYQDRDCKENGTTTYEFDRSSTTLGEIEYDGDEISLVSIVDLNNRPHDKVVKQNKAFFLIKSDPNSLDYFDEYIVELQRLVSLGLNDPVHPEEIVAWTDDRQGFDRMKVEVRQALSRYHDQEPSVHPYHFTSNSIETDLESVLQKWFTDLEDGKILRDLYFGTTYSDGMFEENRLLSLVSAMESYHDRVLFPNDTSIPESEFEDIKDEIHKLASGTGLEDRMNGLIKHVINDVSIKDKIFKFMMKYKYIYESLSDDDDYDHTEVIDEIAKEAAKARHAIAHGNDDLDRDIIGIGGATDWLQIGIEACLLTVVGIDQDRIAHQLRINYYLRLDEVTAPSGQRS